MICSIDNCMCQLPGARPDKHGQPPVPCAKCGGETGCHALGCLGTEESLVCQVIGFDLSEERYRQLVAYEDDE